MHLGTSAMGMVFRQTQVERAENLEPLTSPVQSARRRSLQHTNKHACTHEIPLVDRSR